MENIKELIEDWILINIDNSVRITRRGYVDIVARMDTDCFGQPLKIEYVSFNVGCPCCEDTSDTYYSFDKIDFSNCELEFEAADGSTIKCYHVATGRTQHSFMKELSEQEVEDFFDLDWESMGQWSEGQGRAQTHYEIMFAWHHIKEEPYKNYRTARTTIISLQDYGFDDFNQPKYFLINKQ